MANPRTLHIRCASWDNVAALYQRKLRRGIAALCIGGGEATALAVEML